MEAKKLSEKVEREEVPHQGCFWRVQQPNSRHDAVVLSRVEAFDAAREMWPDLEDDEDA